jgi:hypothetical protein
VTIRRVVVDNSAPVWAKQLETDLNGTLAGIGIDITAGDAAAVATSRLPPGAVVQSAYAEYTANADLSAAIPLDDTIPQITEGTQILSAAITPSSTTSKIRARFQCQFIDNTAARNAMAALFLNSRTDALRTAFSSSGGAGFAQVITLEHEHIPGATTAQTYSIRVGPQGGTIRLNGTGTARLFGGSSAATLVLEEIKV